MRGRLKAGGLYVELVREVVRRIEGLGWPQTRMLSSLKRKLEGSGLCLPLVEAEGGKDREGILQTLSQRSGGS